MSHVFRRLVGTLPISQYFLARYAEEAQAQPEITIGELVRDLYAEIYHRLLDDDDLQAVCQRIGEHGEKVQARAKANGAARQPAKKSSSNRLFSDYFNEFVTQLDASQMCLWLADFDPVRARALYFDEDHEVVTEMADFKVRLSQEQNRIAFEGALFGFGGKYGSATPAGRDLGDVQVHDLSGLTAQEAMERIAAASRRR